MKIPRLLEFTFVGAVLVVVLLVLGALLGQPVLLSYVETGSMSPTMEPGDGFVAVPVQLDGSVAVGDVVVFEAKKLHGGGLTTHRVVGETDRGFVTRGDANPFTDQDGDEPPVKRPQIVATALQVDGEVVVVPHLGTVVEGVRSVLRTVQTFLAMLFGTGALLGAKGLAYLFFAASLLWYAVGEWRARSSRRSARVTARTTGVDARLLVGGLAALLVVGATAAMVVPGGHHEYGVVSAEFDSERPDVIPMGESKDATYPIGNGGLLPVYAYLEPASEGVEVRPREHYVAGRDVVNATVTLHAPPRTGYYRRYVVEHRYLAVLPEGVTDSLYAAHPWMPIVVIDALLAVPFYLVGVRLLGTARVKPRRRGRGVPLSTRLKRLVRD